MKVFELYFNPKANKEVIYDSFVYEPENISEKGMGNLYVVGELNNALSKDSAFLNNLAKIIKKEYYIGASIENQETKISSEQALKKGLKKANELLTEEIKKGNVGWLGNLNFAVLSFKDFILNFTKIGDIKILLLRSATVFDRPKNSSDIEIMDIGTNLEFQNTEPSPSKIFGNIATGKLTPEDKIIILTKNAFELFKNKNIIQELALAREEKELKKILKAKKEIFTETSGICLLLFSGSHSYYNGESIRECFHPPFFQKTKILSSLFNRGFAFLKYIFKILTGLKKNRIIENPELNPAKHWSMSFPPRFSLSSSSKIKKFLILVLILILMLASGYFIFKKEDEQKFSLTAQAVEQAELKIIQAENALIFKDEARAELLFQEAWEKISPFIEEESSFKEEIQSLKKSIEQGLAFLDNLEKTDQLPH